MKIVGNTKPYIGGDLGGVSEEETSRFDHEPDGWSFDEEHEAFLVSVCELCGRNLRAVEIDEDLLFDTGEVCVEEYEVDA